MPQAEIVLQRQKRLAILAVGIIAIFAVAVSTTVGLATHALIENKGLKENLQTLQTKQQELAERLAHLQENEFKVKKIVSLLQSQIEGIGSQVRGISESLKLLQSALPSFMIYVSNIAARFALTRDRLFDISRKWKTGVVDEKLLDIWNFTIPCFPDCDLKGAEPKDCSLNEEKQIVSMIFDIKSTPKDVVLMNADPFVIYSVKENSSIVCPIRYTGPSEVIYSSKLDCVVALPTSSAQNLIIVPNLDSCRNQMPANLTAKYWRPETCENKHTLVIEDVVQIKQVADNNYIYCENFDIKVYERSLECPPFVFALPTTASFSIDTLRYEAKEVLVEGEIDLITPLSQRINFHLFPNIYDFDFDTLAQEVRKEIQNIDFESIQSHESLSSGLRYIDYVYIFAVAILIAWLVFYLYRKYKTHSLKIQNEKGLELQETDLIVDEMTEQPKTRSGKGTKKSKLGRNKHTLLLAHIFLLLTTIECRPIDDVIIMNIHFNSPCAQLTKRNFSWFEITWCETKFNETFLEPINNFCQTPNSVILMNRTLFAAYASREKRDLHFEHLNPKTGAINQAPTIESEWKKLDMASVAASLMIIKSAITKMGTKWQKGELDEQLINSPHISLNLPNNNSLSQYEPLSCLLDKTCKTLRLELKLKRGMNALTEITGWRYSEDILSSMSVALLIIVVVTIRKIRILLRQKEWAYKQLLTSSLSTGQRNEENLLIPPPYPRIENA
jgi:hypothetical protein